MLRRHQRGPEREQESLRVAFSGLPGQRTIILGPFAGLLLHRGVLRESGGKVVARLREATGLWQAPGGSRHQGFSVSSGSNQVVDVRFRRRKGPSWRFPSGSGLRIVNRAIYLEDSEPIAVRALGMSDWAVEPLAARYESVDLAPLREES